MITILFCLAWGAIIFRAGRLSLRHTASAERRAHAAAAGGPRPATAGRGTMAPPQVVAAPQVL